MRFDEIKHLVENNKIQFYANDRGEKHYWFYQKNEKMTPTMSRIINRYNIKEITSEYDLYEEEFLYIQLEKNTTYAVGDKVLTRNLSLDDEYKFTIIPDMVGKREITIVEAYNDETYVCDDDCEYELAMIEKLVEE